jgi:hypothetical protein
VGPRHCPTWAQPIRLRPRARGARWNLLLSGPDAPRTRIAPHAYSPSTRGSLAASHPSRSPFRDRPGCHGPAPRQPVSRPSNYLPPLPAIAAVPRGTPAQGRRTEAPPPVGASGDVSGSNLLRGLGLLSRPRSPFHVERPAHSADQHAGVHPNPARSTHRGPPAGPAGVSRGTAGPATIQPWADRDV